MNRNLFYLGLAVVVFACPVVRGALAPYEFATVSNSITGTENLSAVANNGNVFVCVGSADAPVLAVNTNNFAAFAASNNGGGYLLVSSGWTNTLKSPIKYNYLNCVAAQPNGFIASGTSNTVFVSSDGVNWTNWGNILAGGEQAYSADGIAYNPISGTYAAAMAVYEASWTTNQVSTNVWQVAGLQTESFAESFRGVTAFGTSNMAMCGIFGDIRVSADGGKNWSLSQQVNLSYPYLLSVASDGGSNLVCAGDYSMLEVSTNGGPNASSWAFQTNINIGAVGSSTNFNVVTYNPTETSFLAAGTLGANGLIVTAYRPTTSANWSWVRQTNILTLQNGQLVPLTTSLQALNGAVFANSGFFQGIALLVGNNGTVVIGGTAPESPINSLNLDVTNVLTNPLSNLPLAATIFADTYHPANVLTVDWFTSATGGAPVALNTATYQPTNESCGTYTNWAQARDLRTGFVSPIRTPFVFTIIPAAPANPTSVVNCDPAGQQFGMCAPTPMSVTVLTNAANPPGTIQVNWYNSGTNVATTELPVNGVMSYPTMYSPSTPGIYTFYAQATNPATGFVSTNMTEVTYEVNPLPEWTSTNAIFTNTLMAGVQVNPIVLASDVTNLTAITSLEPGAQIVYDWYTSGDPTVATYENPEAPYAFSSTTPSPGVNEIAQGMQPDTFIPTNVVCGTYTYYVRARVKTPAATACACQSTNLIPVAFTLLPPPPADSVQNLTNVLAGFFQVNAPVWVDVVTNAANPASSFVVNWYTAPQGSNNADYLNDSTATNLGNRFFYTPGGDHCDVFTNWAETMAVNSGLVSPTRIQVEYVIVPATPTAVGDIDVTNCVQVPNPTFTVTVSNVQTANWYVVPGGALAATNTSSFTPTNTSVGTWEFSAQAVDPLSGLVSTGAVLATLSLYDCSSPLSVNLNSANGTGTIQWPGNLTLLSATNLTPPIVWSSVSTGSVFSAPYNSYTFTNTNPPVEYFRLTN